MAVNTKGIINVGQDSLWGNFIWSAIGQAILIPHHTRPGQTAAPFNISGNVHILNTSQEQFRKPTSMAVLACSSQPPSPAHVWRGHTCSSLRHRILELWFSCLKMWDCVSSEKCFQHWVNLRNWIFFTSSLSCLLCCSIGRALTPHRSWAWNALWVALNKRLWKMWKYKCLVQRE